MSVRRRMLAGALAGAALAAGLALTRGSSLADRDAYWQAMILLDELSSCSARLDAELLRVAQGLEVSYDDLVLLEEEAEAIAVEIEEIRALGVESPRRELEQRRQLLEDFKSKFSILRNSTAASIALTRRSVLEPDQTDLRRFRFLLLENAALRSLVGPREEALGLIRWILSEADGASFLEGEHWPYITRHIDVMVNEKVAVDALIRSYLEVPIADRIHDLRSVVGAELDAAAARSSRYGIALIALTAFLLGFGVYQAIRAGRYVRLLKQSNATLEDRVRERTHELEAANRTKS